MSDDGDALGRMLSALAECEDLARLLALYTERPEWVVMAGQFRRLKTGVAGLAGSPRGGLWPM